MTEKKYDNCDNCSSVIYLNIPSGIWFHGNGIKYCNLQFNATPKSTSPIELWMLSSCWENDGQETAQVCVSKSVAMKEADKDVDAIEKMDDEDNIISDWITYQNTDNAMSRQISTEYDILYQNIYKTILAQ